MDLDADACYRALKTRDARFDGRFFTGVTSTGIYCRPICPARTPGRANCRFFSCAAAAQEAGFRPCLRCRPEVAPGLPAWNGTSTTIARALRLIAEGAMDGGSVEQLAARLGIGGRHLRRLFDEQLGASPVAIAVSRRFLFAKKLLAETALPISDIAFAAGFSSVRRFNDAMRLAYGRAPRDLRAKASTVSGGRIELTLPFRPPYNWKALAAFLAPRAIPGVEEINADRYRRNLPGGFVEVRPAGQQPHLLATFELENVRDLANLAGRLQALFDTSAPILDIEQQLVQSQRLRETVARQSGLRVPGAWDPFELTVRAVLGQQVTVKGATTLAGRLVESFGAKTAGGFLFPSPRALAAANIASIGLPRTRAETLRAVAEAFDSASPPETADELRTLLGIGDWTAQYVAMRAFSEPDAFPATDLGLIKAAGRDVAKRPKIGVPGAPMRPCIFGWSTQMTNLYYDEIESPIGTIITAWNGEALCALDYADYRERMLKLLQARFGKVALIARAQPRFHAKLAAYFSGDLAALDRVPIDTGGTEFQRTIWQALREIPAGETATYGEIAARIGAPAAARAVGLANSLNPIAIAVPCHRVIGANGKLTGYAGGLDRKRWLLAHEAGGLALAANGCTGS